MCVVRMTTMRALREAIRPALEGMPIEKALMMPDRGIGEAYARNRIRTTEDANCINMLENAPYLSIVTADDMW
jgi:hypothetical protein